MILANGADSLHMLQRKWKKRYELPTNYLNKRPIILLCELNQTGEKKKSIIVL